MVTILIVAGAILGVAVLVGALASVLGVGPTAEDQEIEQSIRSGDDARFERPRDEGDLL